MSLESAIAKTILMQNIKNNPKSHKDLKKPPQQSNENQTTQNLNTEHIPLDDRVTTSTNTGSQLPTSSTTNTRSSSSSSISSSSHKHKKNIRPLRLPTSTCHLLVEQILNTVGELENTLIEDHQHDFDLRMAFERQTEKLHDLRSTLESEKERNERLMELIRGVDSTSSTEDEDFWQQTRSSMDAFESISPLLMQQRYDELSTSHKQCQRQLARKEKLLTLNKCEKEELQAKYDHLFYEYRNEQKRFEELCCKYLRLQAKKNQEIHKLKDALTYASDCVVNAQQIIDIHCNHGNNHNNNISTQVVKEFRQNLQWFIKTLRLCQWVQNSSRSRNDDK